MANQSSLKKMVTKIKNKLINHLHVADLKQLIEISKFAGVRINETDLKRLESKIKKNWNIIGQMSPMNSL